MIDMYSTYKNFLCQQVSSFQIPFRRFLQTVKPELIIEIGTGQGGFSIFLNDVLNEFNLNCKQLTYDIDNDNNGVILNHNITAKKPIYFFMKDVFTDIDYLTTLINNYGTTIVLCDGGNKVKEFQTFAPLIKQYDFIMGHDYAKNLNFFNTYINQKIWNWFELSGEDIQDVITNNNLQYFMDDDFSKIVWLCTQKV